MGTLNTPLSPQGPDESTFSLHPAPQVSESLLTDCGPEQECPETVHVQSRVSVCFPRCREGGREGGRGPWNWDFSVRLCVCV